ncbi:17449_t:CDS:2, partial [Dentiscutata erythropus]
KPFYDPITPKANNLEAWKEDWKNRFNQCKTLYESIKEKDFISAHEKNKEINKLIRETIPKENYSNIYSIATYWRKSYDNLALIFEEKILEKLRCSNITINYFQEANNEDILKLTSCLKEDM